MHCSGVHFYLSSMCSINNRAKQAHSIAVKLVAKASSTYHGCQFSKPGTNSATDQEVDKNKLLSFSVKSPSEELSRILRVLSAARHSMHL
jgi:hypothetical protein